MIEVQNLTKTYNDVEVLNIEHLKIDDGDVIGLVGNNGAGKTTFFELLLDFIPTTSGQILLNGNKVEGSEHWKSLVAAYLDESFLIEYLTAEEFFSFIADTRKINKTDAENFVMQFEDVFHGEVLEQKKYLRSFSKGNQKKVGLVSTLIGEPPIIYWDEPFANLDPRTQLKMKEMVKEYTANRTWIISSHDLSHIIDVCSRIIILNEGKIIMDVKREDTSLEELIEVFR